jgi:hypothetical protein
MVDKKIRDFIYKRSITPQVAEMKYLFGLEFYRAICCSKGFNVPVYIAEYRYLHPILQSIGGLKAFFY